MIKKQQQLQCFQLFTINIDMNAEKIMKKFFNTQENEVKVIFFFLGRIIIVYPKLRKQLG